MIIDHRLRYDSFALRKKFSCQVSLFDQIRFSRQLRSLTTDREQTDRQLTL